MGFLNRFRRSASRAGAADKQAYLGDFDAKAVFKVVGGIAFFLVIFITMLPGAAIHGPQSGAVAAFLEESGALKIFPRLVVALVVGICLVVAAQRIRRLRTAPDRTMAKSRGPGCQKEATPVHRSRVPPDYGLELGGAAGLIIVGFAGSWWLIHDAVDGFRPASISLVESAIGVILLSMIVPFFFGMAGYIIYNIILFFIK